MASKPCKRCGSTDRVGRNCRPCKNAWERNKRATDPEYRSHDLAKQAQRRADNRDKRNARSLEWYFRVKDTAHYQAVKRSWRDKNADYRRRKMREYQIANPDKVAQYVHARRARVRNAAGSFTSEGWKLLVSALGNRCFDCGASNVKLTIGHAIPLSSGGGNWIDNIIPQCWPCNLKQGRRPHHAFVCGELVCDQTCDKRTDETPSDNILDLLAIASLDHQLSLQSLGDTKCHTLA